MIDQTTNVAPTTKADASEPETKRSLRLWIVLHRAFNAVAELNRRDIAASGLSPGEFAVLEVLYHKGPMLLGEVREKILVSSGGITYLVDRLAGKGLVERRECDTDRRATYAALTDRGRVRIAEIFPGHARMITRALSGLDAEEQEAATALLRKAGLHAEALARGTEG